ncbi:Serine/threonine kinase PKN11 [Minicystis rosea]|nr:Serine/threonine kinase PKN11 [Minicystis rosea]
MAEVFLAARSGPQSFHRLLVLKRLRADLAGDATFRTMLLSEARLAARLHHPNVVQTHEVGEHEGSPFIAMEYLDGQPVHRLVQHDRREPGLLDPTLSLVIVSEALAGLHYAHELSDYDGTPLAIVHRDISPQNIFVTYEGEVKIVDFGIAKAGSFAPDTEVGVLKGKVNYMAPEQARGETIDRRADIFAMGVVLWEMLTKERLFATGNPVLTLQKVLAGDVPAPSTVAAEVSSELDALCAHALELEPDARFQTAAEMRDAIEGYLQRARLHGRRDLVKQRMSGRFTEERARIKRLVHEAMVSAGKGPTSGLEGAISVPVLRLDEATRVESSGDITRRETRDPVSVPASSSSATPAPVGASDETQIAVAPGRADDRRRWVAGVGTLGVVLAGALLASALRIRDGDRRVPDTNPSARPEATAPEVELRLRGSNTIGAALAPELVEAFLRHEGATAASHAPAPSGHGMLITAVEAGRARPRAISVTPDGSATAFECLADGSCDIGMSSRPIKPEEAESLEKKGFVDMRSAASEHVIGLDGIAVVVHQTNSIRSATRDDLRRAFSGAITDWSALGGSARPITVHARDDVSGTFDTFKHLVLGDSALVATAKRFSDSAALSDAVAADASAMGFIGVAYTRNAKPVSISDAGTTALLPSAFTVTTEEYLLSRRLYLYCSGRPKNPAILRFLNFALSEAGQKVVRSTGFIDLGVELESPGPCAGRCTPGYALRVQHAQRLSVNFRFRAGTTQLDSRGVRDVDRLVSFLRQHSDKSLMLIGFSADEGSAAQSLADSRARAKAVEAELGARGVHVGVVEGRGAEMPIASNADPTQRERNRRVETWLVANGR